MILYSLGGWNRLIVKAIGIHTVRAINFYLSLVYQVSDRINKLEILTFKIAPFSGGKNNHRVSIMTIYQHFYIHAEGG
jgi:hypothetical protein